MVVDMKSYDSYEYHIYVVYVTLLGMIFGILFLNTRYHMGLNICIP